MKKKLGICVLAFAVFAFSSCGAKKSGTKKIVVGLDDNYPPMGFVDETNTIVGFDVDMAKEATKRLGYDVEFKAIDWSSKEAELKSGRIDVLWNGLDITEKRKENMLFSDAYMDNRQIMFVAKGKADSYKSEKDLAGKNVGTQSGGTAEEYIDSNSELKSSMKDFKKYSDYISAFMDLENGRLDVIVSDEITGRYYMSKHPDKIDAVAVVVGPVSEFGIGFRKTDTELRNTVQKALNEMKADGGSAKISKKWFAADIVK